MKTTSAEPNFMNNLLSYCGLVDAKISASEKGLPVKESQIRNVYCYKFEIF